MFAEKQSLGTDLRYSSVCLITPILRDHFRFVGKPEVIQIGIRGSVPQVGFEGLTPLTAWVFIGSNLPT